MRVLQRPRQGLHAAQRTAQHGGHFGAEYGGLGHKTHQNGLDIDVPYPRRDGREAEPMTPSQIDRRDSQLLLDLWLRTGRVTAVYIGYNSGLHGPGGVVRAIPAHDDHMHVSLLP